MKKLLILALILASTMGCFMHSTLTTSVPITLPNGTQSTVTVTVDRNIFTSVWFNINPVSGLVSAGIDTSPQLDAMIQEIGTLAMTSAVMFGTPAPQPGPLKQRILTSITGQ